MRFLIAVLLATLSHPAFALHPVELVDTPYGRLYRPADGGQSHPGVIVFHGSEGGGRAYNGLQAQHLAMHGYAALAYCYYQCLTGMGDISDPPVEFIDISIDKPFAAFKWLKSSRYVDGHKMAIVGTSKGAELALLITALTTANGDGPNVVAAHAVTDVVELGFSWNWYSKKCWIGSPKQWNPACGTPPPNGVPPRDTPAPPQCIATPSVPNESYPFHSWTWNGSHDAVGNHSPIALERFNGPIFFTHGEQDKLWCVSKAQSLQARLVAAGKKPEVHIFPGEGHMFSAASENKRLELLVDFLNRNMN